VAHKQYFDLNAGNQKLTLNLERLPISTYFVQIHKENGVMETYKVLKR